MIATAQTMTVASIGDPPRCFITPCPYCGCGCDGHPTNVTLVAQNCDRLSLVVVEPVRSFAEEFGRAVVRKAGALDSRGDPFHRRINRKPWEKRR